MLDCSTKVPAAAARMIGILEDYLVSLTDVSERGRPLGDGIRELIVPFGGSNYVIRYEVSPESVFVSRIWHVLEDRQP
jgi:plasmid stabilization system protein ParE